MSIPIVDAHHHIWRYADVPWLHGPAVPRIFGDYDALRRDYLIEEYAADCRPCDVVQSVYIQINVARGDEIREVEAAAAEGARCALVQGIVAFADLCAPDVGSVLDAQLEVGPVRGVRQQLHWHTDPAKSFASRPDLILDSAFQRGLLEVSQRDLLFELQLFAHQFDDALTVVDRFPDTTFVLLHAGMSYDRTPEGVTTWAAGLARVAERDNVLVKLSGLGTFAHECSSATWQPIIARTIETFGPSRCMFGSNFPIEKMWTSYDQLVDVFVSAIDDLSVDDRAAILHGTARHAYRLPDPVPERTTK
ncbi:MAG: hypothetical protein QOJ66_2899 [Ilumatobacteraceae bacterium]